VPGLSRQTAVAGGVPLPEMSGGGSLGHGAGLASLPGVRSADLGDGGDLVCGHASALASLVRSTVARDQSEKRGQLGLGSYRTAWNLLHKLRRAMVRPGHERLQGIIEVDEIFIGGPRPGKRGRGAQGKVLVVVAAQQAAKGIGRIRLTRVADASARSLEPAITAAIEAGSQVRTDDWRGYGGLDRLGYRRQIIRTSAEVGENLLPLANRVASLLKRWLLGTHQGAVSVAHLDYYLDEYTFRFNRRTSGSRGLLFLRLMQQAVDLSPVPASNPRRPADLGKSTY
jgi:transposase-like protein